jgi:hypothetical protein
MPIIQSSGAGKSQLMDEYAKTAVGINFTLRSGEQSGYPPGDVEITKCLQSAAGTRSTEHATVIALISTAVKLGVCRPPMLELNLQSMLTGIVTDELDDYCSTGAGIEGFASYLRDKSAPPDQGSQVNEYSAA